MTFTFGKVVALEQVLPHDQCCKSVGKSINANPWFGTSEGIRPHDIESTVDERCDDGMKRRMSQG